MGIETRNRQEELPDSLGETWRYLLKQEIRRRWEEIRWRHPHWRKEKKGLYCCEEKVPGAPPICYYLLPDATIHRVQNWQDLGEIHPREYTDYFPYAQKVIDRACKRSYRLPEKAL